MHRLPTHPEQSQPAPGSASTFDSAGPFLRTMFLIVVDAPSKLPEVIPIATTNITTTIDELRKLFTPHGLPEQLASDIEPQFIANKFRAFVRSNGTEHVRSAPYYPATNALAERLVQTFKQVFRATMPERKCLRSWLTCCWLIEQHHIQTTGRLQPYSSWEETSEQD